LKTNFRICLFMSLIFVITVFSLGLKSSDRSIEFVNVNNPECFKTAETEFLNILKEESIVNINEAGVEKLTTLNGVGEKTARKIIVYRVKNGCFNNIEEIINVDGIGEVIYENIKDYITIGGEETDG